MRRLATLFAILLLGITGLFAQAPNKFSYQAVVRNVSNQLVTNTLIGIRVSILQNSATGSVLYSETQMLSTNANGLVTMNIGEGTVVYGSFNNIDWNAGTFFLKSEIDPAGGSNYSISSTQQLLSVPYALYANEAGNVFSGDYNDLTNRPQIPQAVGELTNDANYITLEQVPAQVNADWNATSGVAEILNKPTIPTVPTVVSAFTNDAGYLIGYTETDPQFNAWDKDYNDLTNTPSIPTVPTNVSAFTNDAGYLTGYTETDPQYNAWDKDYNDLINKPTIPTVPTNLSAFTNDAGYITGYTETDPQFNAWDKDYNDLTNKPTIPTVPTNVSAFNNDVPYLTAEQQILSISHDTIFLTGGSFVKLPEGFDGDYNSLTNTPSIPTVPTNVSAFTNDAGYLTGYTETDPQFNAWDKDYNDLTNTPSIPTVPTNVSAFTNDAGYITGYTETDPQFNAWDKDYNDLTNLPQIPQIPADISAFNNDVPYLTAEQQILSISNDTIFLTGGSFVKLPEGFSGDYNDLTNTPNLNQLTDSVMNIILMLQQQWETQQQQWQQQQMQLQQQIDSLNEQVSQIPHTENTTWNTSVTNETVCDSLVWHGETYTESGIYLHGWTDAEGINNMEALNLTVQHPATASVEAAACEAYTWNGTTYEESGDYQQTFTAANGCDSVVTLHLTIYNGTHNVIMADTCESYAWKGQTYTESGTYTYAYTNTDGCASMDMLHLTIHHGTHNVDTVTACESYTWHDSTYTQSGVYTYAYENDYGCASVDTLYLTVHYGTHNVETLNACGSYEWHGQTYTESGTYTYAYNNEHNCSSVDTLKVVVVLVDEKSCSLAPCVTDVDGNMYSTVQIGGQCWMRSNLRATHFPDGTSILYGGNDNPWSNTEPYYYEYSNCFTLEQRGYAYNWLAMTHGENGSDTSTIGIQGICPDGWHVPTNEEWTQLTNYISAQNDYVCDNNNTYIAKALASNTAYWGSSNGTCPCCPCVNQNENNATGFNAVPAASSTACYWRAGFWSSSFISNKDLYEYRIIQSHEPDVKSLSNYNVGNKSAPFAVRCVYDISACGTEFEGTYTVDTVTACDSYTWHGQTYTESGTYTYAYQNIYGCPSEDTLKLTIYQGCTIDEKSCPGTPIMMDIDSNVYSTVQIGDQCWMRSNLRATRYADGTAVPAGNSAYSETDPYYYDYENCFTLPERGYYYNWPAVMHGQPSSTTNPSEVQGICPDGWHVPSDLEWKQMSDYVTSKSEYYCSRYPYFSAASLASNTGWTYYGGVQCAPGDNTPHNATGFSAIPAGYYQLVGRIGYAGYVLNGADCTMGAYFWGSTENSADNAYYRAIDNMSHGFNSRNVSKDVGFSVRCVMNAEADSLGYTIDEKSCPGTPSVTDIDGNTYGTVQLGEQCWMRSNLRATRYADGTAVPAGHTNFSKTEPYYYDFSGLGSDGTSQFFPLSKRGYLYNWAAAMHGAASSNTNPSQVQGICPDGWHVPSNEEWTQLENYVKSQSQYSCCTDVSGNNSCIARALTSTMGWRDYYHGHNCNPGYNRSANNATGFNAMPVGIYAYNGYQSATEVTWFLSSTENDSASIHFCMLWYNGTYLGRFIEPKDKGYSVRCLRNDCGTHNVETVIVVDSPTYTWHGQTYNEDGTYTFAYFNEAGCRSVDTLKLKINYFTVDEKSCPGTPSVTDVDGNMYSTVQIGDQCWMRSNLRATHYADGTTIPIGNNSSNTDPYYYDYSNQRFTLRERGYLYNWPAIMHNQSSSNTVPSNVQGICPNGWHLPSNAEWTELENYVKSQSQYRCGGNSNDIAKAMVSTYGWKNYNNAVSCLPGTDTATNNATGFSAIPAGLCAYGNLSSCYEDCFLWSATDYGNGSTSAWYRRLHNGNTNFPIDRAVKSHGCSVRCLKDTASSGGDTPCIGTHNVETESSCEAYTWHGQTYAQNGIYTYAYTNNDGCASVDTLKLTVNQSVASTNSATTCESYTWNGQTYTQSGDYTQTFTAANGCDSVVTLHLTIYQPVATTSSATACESYSWNGTTYTQSGDYTQTLTAANGCDSVVTLHLTIYQPVATTSSATACESYTWHEQTYTQSGDYTYNYTNEYGCPCTETLNLTINHGSHNVFTETAEGSYTWHEQTYSESGTYTYTYNNAQGCASVDTLNLTVTSNPPTPPTPPSDTIADGYPCPNAHTVTDHEGNVYNTVQIGNQCWTKENMRCTTSPSTGTTILEVYPNGTSYTGKKAYYVNGNSYNTPSYGLLYNWNAAVDTFNTAYGETSTNSNSSNAVSVAFTSHRRGICPQGWHVPSDAEWTQLINYVSSKSRYQCGSTGGSIAKALADTTGWNIYSIPCTMGNDLSANNATGFSALPAGAYFGNFYYFGDAADFWSTTSSNGNSAHYNYLYYDYAGVHQDVGNKYSGISVRCLMDSAIGGDTPCISTYNVETENACESFTWHGQTYSQSGTYTYAYTNDNGCASMDTLFLTIYNGTHNTYTESAEGSYIWHEQTYSESGTYTYAYTNALGCASVDTLHLTVTSNPPTPPTPPTPPADTIADGYPCPNAHTATDHQGNVYNTVLIGSQCWTKENMRCTTSPSTGSSLLTDFSSSASKAASWHPNNASHDPAYGLIYNWCAALDTFKTTGGVPEVASANSSTTLYCTISGHRRGICPQGWHVPNDTEWAQLMAYVYNNGYRCSDCSYLSLSADFTSCIAKALSDTTGWNTDDEECVVGNDLSTNNATGFSALPGGCYSSNSYRNYGQRAYFWSADVSYGYADYVYMSYNYDEMTRIDERMSAKMSVRCLKDVFDCGTHSVETAMDCESYTWHGQTYNATGTYTYEYTNERGCASVDTLKLTIQEHVYLETSVAACNEYTSHGQNFTSSGTYTYDFVNEHDCPSSETLHLTIYNSEYPTFSVSECESYTWHGQTYTASGTYTHDYTNEHGCPCTETLNLTIYEPETPSTSASACESYTWHGHTYNASGTYTHEFQDLHGCTGTETLHLTIYNGTHTAISAGDCEYYTWHDNDYDQSGIYTYAYTDEHGCTCTDTLKLVIQEHVNITTSVEACEYYVWRDSIYTESGTYIANYINNHGCITTETLILTIHHGTHNSYTEEVCSYYVWHDSTITQSGDYTYAYLDEHGCASVDTLHLTIGSNSCPGTPTVTDHEGNVYNTVQIGSQCWTKENMRCYTSPSTGSNLVSSKFFASQVSKSATYPDKNESNVATYGVLYNWCAAMDIYNQAIGCPEITDSISMRQYMDSIFEFTANDYHRGICPPGWHIPSDADWAQLASYVFNNDCYRCGDCNFPLNYNYTTTCIGKSLASTTGWKVFDEDTYESGYFWGYGGSACYVGYNSFTNNATGFSAMPAGYVELYMYHEDETNVPTGLIDTTWVYSSRAHNFGEIARFWSSTDDYNDNTGNTFSLQYDDSCGIRRDRPTGRGQSVRCLRNAAVLPDE